MIRKKHKYCISILTALITGFIFSEPANSQKESCWNVFRGDQALTGTSVFEFPAKPEILWTFKVDDEIKSSPVSCDDKIVFGAGDGFIYCLDINGKLIWKFNSNNTIEAPAIILEGNVYIGNLGGSLFSLNLNTGWKNWEYITDGQISGSPNYWKTGNNLYILVGSYDFNLHCVDAQTGKNKWKYESDNYINGAAACQSGVAVFGGCDGFLHLVDISTGNLKKKVEVATYVAGSASLSESNAFIGDYDGRFTCVGLNDQKIKWQWQDEITNLPFICSPSVLKDRILTGNDNKYIYCLDKMTGKMIWKFNTGSRVEASTVVSHSKVLVANMRGDLFLLDVNNGKKLWSFEIGTPVSATPAILKDRFIVAAIDGTVYCFGTKK
jgi:outer membrane protein assembly factor BamB